MVYVHSNLSLESSVIWGKEDIDSYEILLGYDDCYEDNLYRGPPVIKKFFEKITRWSRLGHSTVNLYSENNANGKWIGNAKDPKSFPEQIIPQHRGTIHAHQTLVCSCLMER